MTERERDIEIYRERDKSKAFSMILQIKKA